VATEIERKFLPASDIWRDVAAPGMAIFQGYLLTGEGTSVRIRTRDDEAFLTIKGPSVGMARPEFEYSIPLEDARAMLPLCGYGAVEKTRYLVEVDRWTWEIDVFSGANEGLVLAEVELTSETEQPTIPEWIGQEVTGDHRYFNGYLATRPFRDWPASQS